MSPVTKRYGTSSPRRLRLRKDIIIPAGTVLDEGPKEIGFPVAPYEHILGFGPDACGYLLVPAGDLPEEYFELLVEEEALKT